MYKWLYHLDSDETLGEKAWRWQQHDDAACYFEQILSEVPHEIYSHLPLTDHPRKVDETFWTLLVNQKRI